MTRFISCGSKVKVIAFVMPLSLKICSKSQVLNMILPYIFFSWHPFKPHFGSHDARVMMEPVRPCSAEPLVKILADLAKPFVKIMTISPNHLLAYWSGFCSEQGRPEKLQAPLQNIVTGP